MIRSTLGMVLAATAVRSGLIRSDRRTADGSRPLIVHNIGNGPEVSDVLFE